MTDPNTGKVPLTVWVDPPPVGMRWERLDESPPGDLISVDFALRPIVPATVMVTLPGDLAERVRALKLTTFPSDDEMQLRGAIMMGLANARAALARKWVCDSFVCTEDYEHGCRTIAHSRKVCDLVDSGRHHTDRKPCPVMVHPWGTTKALLCEDPTDPDRRPCKHKDGEGHGGEHE